MRISSLMDWTAGLGESLVVWLRAHNLKYEGPKFKSSRIKRVLSHLTPNLVSRVIHLPTHLEVLREGGERPWERGCLAPTLPFCGTRHVRELSLLLNLFMFIFIIITDIIHLFIYYYILFWVWFLLLYSFTIVVIIIIIIVYFLVIADIFYCLQNFGKSEHNWFHNPWWITLRRSSSQICKWKSSYCFATLYTSSCYFEFWLDKGVKESRNVVKINVRVLCIFQRSPLNRNRPHKKAHKPWVRLAARQALGLFT